MQPDNTELLKLAAELAGAGQASGECCGAGGCPACELPPADPPAQASAGPQASRGRPLQFAGLQAGERLLLLGRGIEEDLPAAAVAVGSAGRVTGVDNSAALLALGRRREAARHEQYGLHNTEFREGRSEDLPLFDNSVDAVLANGVLCLSPDPSQALREMHRVLRPGGRLLLGEPVLEDGAGGAANGLLGCRDCLAALEAAGFGELQVLSLQRFGGGEASAAACGPAPRELPAGPVAALILLAVRTA